MADADADATPPPELVARESQPAAAESAVAAPEEAATTAVVDNKRKRLEEDNTDAQASGGTGEDAKRPRVDGEPDAATAGVEQHNDGSSVNVDEPAAEDEELLEAAAAAEAPPPRQEDGAAAAALEISRKIIQVPSNKVPHLPSPSAGDPRAMDADAAVAAARDGQTALALRLAKHLAPPPPGAGDAAAACGGNVAFSPVSVHAALALAAAGARGATLAQLLAFLGAHSTTSLTDLGRHVAHHVLADRPGSHGPRVLFGGGVWVDASRGGLSDAFRDVAAESYKSEARTVSFASKPGEAVKMINEWVKKATDDLIDSVISTSDIAADTDLVLANAVYFKGDRMRPFQPYGTFTGTFHLLNGCHAKAEFMSQPSGSPFSLQEVACMDGFKVLKIPYEAKWDGGSRKYEAEYSMFVFLPDTRDGLATMVEVVTASPAFMYSILSEMKCRYVNLKLPKFKITFNWGNLKETLCQLGLTLPFSPVAADLRGMCDGAKGDDRTRQAMFLSKVAHMAVVNVNERGTEARAVTFKVRGFGKPDIVEFTADHPFTFFIMEERSGVIVFAGHVLDPTK